MNFLKKRETPVQNISYIGIMAAVNVVFVLISSFLPILFILLVFILPLTSVIVTIYCKKAYFPVYFVTNLALTFAVTSGFSVFDTFIYVLPSLISGYLIWGALKIENSCSSSKLQNSLHKSFISGKVLLKQEIKYFNALMFSSSSQYFFGQK